MPISAKRVAAAPGDEPHRPIAAHMQLGAHGQHQLLTDVPPDNLGNDLGPDAHELYDAALASCKILTVLWYAKKKGLPVTDVQATVTSDRSREREGVYVLQAELTISGELSEAQLRELHSVAERCPVHKIMTQGKTEIHTSVRAA